MQDVDLVLALLALLIADDRLPPERADVRAVAEVPAALSALAAAIDAVPGLVEVATYDLEDACVALDLRAGARWLRCEGEACGVVAGPGKPCRTRGKPADEPPALDVLRGVRGLAVPHVDTLRGPRDARGRATDAGMLAIHAGSGHVGLRVAPREWRWIAVGATTSVNAVHEASALLGPGGAALEAVVWSGGSGQWETAEWLVAVTRTATAAVWIGEASGGGSIGEHGLHFAGEGHAPFERPRGCLARNAPLVPGASRWPAARLDAIRPLFTRGRVELGSPCTYRRGPPLPARIEGPGALVWSPERRSLTPSRAE